MEKSINFEGYFSITEKGNKFVIKRVKPMFSKKWMYFFIGVLVFLLAFEWWLYEENEGLNYYLFWWIGYPISFVIQYFMTKGTEVVHKEDIQNIQMKNGIFNFNTRLVINLNNGRKLRFYFSDEKSTQRLKYFLESPMKANSK